MAELGEEKNMSGVFGGVEIENNENNVENVQNVGNVENQEPKAEAGVFGGINVENNEKEGNNLPAKTGFWSKFKAFWLQDIDWNKEIKVELTPYQQKVEDEINEFLHQEITWKKVHDFLFQDISFGSKKKEKA